MGESLGDWMGESLDELIDAGAALTVFRSVLCLQPGCSGAVGATRFLGKHDEHRALLGLLRKGAKASRQGTCDQAL